MAHIRFSRTILLAALAASLTLLLPASASARIRGGGGFGFYGPVYPYAYWGGPYGYWGGGPYGYWGGGPYGYPYGYGTYGSYGRPLGEVKIKSPDGNAQIYINGSLAGRAHDLKHFYLAPGRYTIEQRIGDDVQRQRIYVLADRTVRLEFGKPGSVPPAPPEPDAGVPPPPPEPDAGAPPPAQ